MEQFTLFDEPITKEQMQDTEIRMLKESIVNMRKGLFKRYDHTDKELAEIRQNIALINQKLGISEDIFKIFSIGDGTSG